MIQSELGFYWSVAIFPILFMFHEFEEIVFIKPWYYKNKEVLSRRFPKVGKFIGSFLENMTTEAFALAVFEEFVILSLINYLSLYYEVFDLWLIVFLGFAVHIFIHIFQWVIYRAYIPCIITSILLVPYIVYTVKVAVDYLEYTLLRVIVYTILGIGFVIINLLLIHYTVRRLNRFLVGKDVDKG